MPAAWPTQRRISFRTAWICALAASLVALAPNLAGALPRTGAPAPALILPLIDGRTLDVGALKGKVVIVNFWATWCTPCRAEMPSLDAYYRAHRAEGLEVVGVSQDKERDRAKVKSVMSAFAYPAGLDLDARADGFGPINALPATFILDRHGVVRAVMNLDGKPLNAETLDPVIRPLLREDGVKPAR
jgi:thiol-disulfide isomerase/thioredoxin